MISMKQKKSRWTRFKEYFGFYKVPEGWTLIEDENGTRLVPPSRPLNNWEPQDDADVPTKAYVDVQTNSGGSTPGLLVSDSPDGPWEHVKPHEHGGKILNLPSDEQASREATIAVVAEYEKLNRLLNQNLPWWEKSDCEVRDNHKHLITDLDGDPWCMACGRSGGDDTTTESLQAKQQREERALLDVLAEQPVTICDTVGHMWRLGKRHCDVCGASFRVDALAGLSDLPVSKPVVKQPPCVNDGNVCDMVLPPCVDSCQRAAELLDEFEQPVEGTVPKPHVSASQPRHAYRGFSVEGQRVLVKNEHDQWELYEQ